MRKAIARAKEIKSLQADYDSLREDIEAELLVAGVNGVRFKGWVARVVDKKGSSKLDRKVLLAELESAGVDDPVGLIGRCLTTGTASHYVQLDPPKEEEE